MFSTLLFTVVCVHFASCYDDDVEPTGGWYHTRTLGSLFNSVGTVRFYTNASEGGAIPNTRLVIAGKSKHLKKTCKWIPEIKERLGPVSEELVIQVSPIQSRIDVVLVAPQSDVLPLTTAIAPLFPDYFPAMGGGHRDMEISAIVVEREDPSFYGDKVVNHEEHTTLQGMIDSVRQTAALYDLPANLLNTNAFVNHSRDVAARVGAKVEVLRMEELKKRGFNGIVSVGQAAVEEPALVVLTHEGPDPSKTVALVGKGNVFDTGGLNIKTGSSMNGMKSDLGGAAGVLHAFESLVQNGFQHRLHVILGVAYNAVGPKSTRPDDVITMYSGKTVEISNIDAEGRLLIGDGAAYAAKDLNASLILTMATLTGAVGRAIGSNHAGILSNEEQLYRAAEEAGRASSDQTFPIIYAPEFHLPSLMSSSVADMKNSGGSPGASTGGLFVGAQFDFDRPWIHIDIAFTSEERDRGTGNGVALISTMFGKFTTASLLKDSGPDFEI